jgi:hypothetical protein
MLRIEINIMHINEFLCNVAIRNAMEQGRENQERAAF